MTQARVLQEAKAAGVSGHDIHKRRIWLGENGEGLHATCEVEQAGRQPASGRQPGQQPQPPRAA